jgi:hypothetical protein
VIIWLNCFWFHLITEYELEVDANGFFEHDLNMHDISTLAGNSVKHEFRDKIPAYNRRFSSLQKRLAKHTNISTIDDTSAANTYYSISATVPTQRLPTSVTIIRTNRSQVTSRDGGILPIEEIEENLPNKGTEPKGKGTDDLTKRRKHYELLIKIREQKLNAIREGQDKE